LADVVQNADLVAQDSESHLAAAAEPAPFNLVRWFAVLAFVCIAAVSAVSSLLLSGFLKQQLMMRDAAVSQAWIQSIAYNNDPAAFFANLATASGGSQVEEFIGHVASLPDVLLANIYSPHKRVLWSSEAQLIGREFPDNHGLDEALGGNLSIALGDSEDLARAKPEHMFPGAKPVQFVELYLPVRATVDGPVIGVVEIYRHADALFDAIRKGTVLIWGSGAAGGLLVFAALFWLIRRANRTMAEQQRQLIETESLAVVGEMSTVVAHGIRNPLAVIRSSAELLACDIDPGPAGSAARESAQDITKEVDRLEQWIRGLLTYAQPVRGKLENVMLGEVIRTCLSGFTREFERRGIVPTVDVPEDAPQIRGNRALLFEVLNNVVSNAIDAMPTGGRLNVRVHRADMRGRLRASIQDSGVGIARRTLNDVFTPFFTTKGKGVGLGLALSRRILRRCGGDLALQSTPGRGTTVNLELQVARD
jgi:two-component system sensor histidine kinase HydH